MKKNKSEKICVKCECGYKHYKRIDELSMFAWTSLNCHQCDHLIKFVSQEIYYEQKKKRLVKSLLMKQIDHDNKH